MNNKNIQIIEKMKKNKITLRNQYNQKIALNFIFLFCIIFNITLF